jgi:hypothetical protein
MTRHGALSIIATIKPGMQQQVIDWCKEIEEYGVDDNPVIPFRKITGIHFARIVVLPDRKDISGQPIPARLVFTTNYDLPLEDHMHELVSVAGKGLWHLFSMCEKFPDKTSYSDADLIAYMKSVTIKTATFYVGVGNRSVQEIRQENELRMLIESYLDKQQANNKNTDASVIRRKVIEFVNSTPSLSWAQQPVGKASLSWKIYFYGKLVFVILLFVVLLPIIIPFVIIWMLLILLTEISEKDLYSELNKDHVRELISRETGMVQCQFSALGNVKPGWVRKTTMLFLLKMTNFLAPYLFSKGKLSGIPTVHFARWLIVNKNKEMVFLSNFDGNSESYLRDFINIAGKQLSLMFCHTEGYPKTRFMVIGGADDASGFMRWARRGQVITNVWYSANPTISVSNIFHNAKIREGLYGSMTEKEAGKWLSLF